MKDDRDMLPCLFLASAIIVSILVVLGAIVFYVVAK